MLIIITIFKDESKNIDMPNSRKIILILLTKRDPRERLKKRVRARGDGLFRAVEFPKFTSSSSKADTPISSSPPSRSIFGPV